jgi:hypothetical protein
MDFEALDTEDFKAFKDYPIKFDIKIFFKKINNLENNQYLTKANLIGKGGFGEIFELNHTGNTTKYIIKIMSIKNFLQIKSIDETSIDKISNEIKLLYFLSKKNIIPQFILCLYLKDNEEYGIISHKYDSDLSIFIKEQYNLINDNKTIRTSIENQIISLYNIILNYNIVCFDIKLSNILIKKINETIYEIRLNDIDTHLCCITDLFDVISSKCNNIVIEKEYIHVLYGFELFIESAKHLNKPLYYNMFISKKDYDIKYSSIFNIIIKLKIAYDIACPEFIKIVEKMKTQNGGNTTSLTYSDTDDMDLYSNPDMDSYDSLYPTLPILEFTKIIHKILQNSNINNIIYHIYRNIWIHLNKYDFHKHIFIEPKKSTNPDLLPYFILNIINNIYKLNFFIMNILYFVYNYEEINKEKKFIELSEDSLTFISDNTLRLEDILKFKDTLRPEDIFKFKNTLRPEDILKSKDTLKPEDIFKFKDTLRPEDILKFKDTLRPEDILKSKDTLSPEDILKSKDTLKYNTTKLCFR